MPGGVRRIHGSASSTQAAPAKRNRVAAALDIPPHGAYKPANRMRVGDAA
jgi:hypothetical protein